MAWVIVFTNEEEELRRRRKEKYTINVICYIVCLLIWPLRPATPASLQYWPFHYHHWPPYSGQIGSNTRAYQDKDTCKSIGKSFCNRYQYGNENAYRSQKHWGAFCRNYSVMVWLNKILALDWPLHRAIPILHPRSNVHCHCLIYHHYHPATQPYG